jgi:hypothetical protein
MEGITMFNQKIIPREIMDAEKDIYEVVTENVNKILSNATLEEAKLVRVFMRYVLKSVSDETDSQISVGIELMEGR